MHTELFGEVHKGELFRYYRNINDRLVKDPENGYGYHLSANDFYIYIMAHEYKHFSNGGTGIRSLLDTYVIWQKLGKELDAACIKAECTKLGISEFEQKNKQLSLHLFGDEALTDDDREMLEYIIFSGTYGTVQNSIENSVKKYGGGKKVKENTYSKIRCINCISSDDLVNWTDHGRIPVAGSWGIARWAINSWAPCAAHKEIDGKEKFFL